MDQNQHLRSPIDSANGARRGMVGHSYNQKSPSNSRYRGKSKYVRIPGFPNGNANENSLAAKEKVKGLNPSAAAFTPIFSQFPGHQITSSTPGDSYPLPPARSRLLCSPKRRNFGQQLIPGAMAESSDLQSDGLEQHQSLGAYSSSKVCAARRNSRRAKSAESSHDANKSANRMPSDMQIQRSISYTSRDELASAVEALSISTDPQQSVEKLTKWNGDSRKMFRPPPVPTKEYLSAALDEPRPLSKPRHLLVILDLNGTLLHRPKRTTSITKRPGLDDFLKYVFREHSVMVWTSCQPKTMLDINNKVFNPGQIKALAGAWARDTLGLSAEEYKEKSQVYKQFDTVWDNNRIQRSHPNHSQGGKFDQTNTVLIDDSILKASAEPFNLIAIPEYKKENEEQERNDLVLLEVVDYLKTACMYNNVSAFMKHNPYSPAQALEGQTC